MTDLLIDVAGAAVLAVVWLGLRVHAAVVRAGHTINRIIADKHNRGGSR